MAETARQPQGLRELIDRMVSAKEAMNAQRDLLNDFRREARSDGLNMQALNPLIDILGENSHDRGSRTLNDLVDYARAAGADLDLPQVPMDRNEGPSGMAKVDTAEPDLATGQPDLAAASASTRSRHRAWSKNVVRATLAILVSIALIWLLN